MNASLRSPAGLLLLWSLLLLLSLLTHPLLPVDETRYVTVAWEMWQRGDFLVPYLNGEPYSHKPPLFFWLIHLGWWLFGVNEWWPRSVGALVSLAVLYASARLAARMWPRERAIPRLVPWVLFGSIFWTAFFSWVQIDMLLVLFTVLGMLGLVEAARNRRAGWLLTGVALGAGILAKGPVIVLQVLPVALLAPLWVEADARRSWVDWYGGVTASLLLGAGLALLWALPAAQDGGAAYSQAIFWGQTAHRVVHSFAHAQPWWWYLPWLPVLFGPWLLFPWLWQRLPQSLRQSRDTGQRFCVVWLGSVLVILSLISGKQIKYLLPLLPAFALLLARFLAGAGQRGLRLRLQAPAMLLLLAGAVLLVLPRVLTAPAWVAEVSLLWGAAVMISALPGFFCRPVPATHYPVVVAIGSAWLVAVIYAGIFRVAAPAYDLRAASQLLATAQTAGRPVANLARYHGQFGFYGRLMTALEIPPPERLGEWIAAHPDAYVVVYYREKPDRHPGMVFSQAYRGSFLVIWEGSALAADPALLP